MPKRTQNFDDPFASVTIEPLYTSEGSKSSRNAVILDPHGLHQEVGIVSDSYQLVPNAIVYEIATDVLTRTEMPFEEDSLIFDGKRFRQRWVLPDLAMQPVPGDIVNVALDVINSYDGSTQFGVMFNARRLVCSNGMILDFMLGGFKFKHFGHEEFMNELQQAAHVVQNLANRLEPVTGKLQRLVETPITREDIQRTFRDLKQPMKLQAEVFLSIEEDSLWGLYNAFTHVLTQQNTHRSDNLNRQVSRHLLAA